MCVLSFVPNSRKTAMEMHEILQTAFGENGVGKTETSEWFLN